MTLHRPHHMQSWLINAVLCIGLTACGDNHTTPQTAPASTSSSATTTTAPTPQAPTPPSSSTTASLPAPFTLAQQKNCVVCHSITSKMVGSWISVSEHYRNDKNAVSTLTARILNGGSGTFGAVAMPPQTSNLTPEEAKYLAQWVLTLK